MNDNNKYPMIGLCECLEELKNQNYTDREIIQKIDVLLYLISKNNRRNENEPL